MNRRDIEKLSAYLDGELKSSESTRLEARLKTDPELASVINDLRTTRTLLRKLPSRKAPRNFTLTRKMVGQNPPLPRTYPIFRLATVVATLLFFFSIGINSFGTQMASQNLAYYGIGGGSGGGGDSESLQADAPAMESAVEEPAAPPPAAAAATEDPVMTEEPAASSDVYASTPAADQPTDEASRIEEAQVPKNAEPELIQETSPLVSSTWQIGLVAIAGLSALLMGLMRRLSAQRWKK